MKADIADVCRCKKFFEIKIEKFEKMKTLKMMFFGYESNFDPPPHEKVYPKSQRVTLEAVLIYQKSNFCCLLTQLWFDPTPF